MDYNQYRVMTVPELQSTKQVLVNKLDKLLLIGEAVSEGGKNRSLSEAEHDRCDTYERHIETIDAYLQSAEFRTIPLRALFIMALRHSVAIDKLREEHGLDSKIATAALRRFWGMTVIIGNLLNNHEVQIDALCYVATTLEARNKLGGIDFQTGFDMYVNELKARGFKVHFES